MSVTLAMSWHPRGELARLQRYIESLTAIYDAIIIALPPDVEATITKALDDLPVRYVIPDAWGKGRYLCLQTALETPAETIHYCDADRLIRWVELRPDELKTTVDFIKQHDYVVIGRTAAAWDTHPRALFETEKIINDTFSYLLGKTFDFGSGSKGMSRRAAEFIMRHGVKDHGLGTDTEWSVLVYRAGFDVQDFRVAGLDWETADRDQDVAADANLQRQLAAQLDADVQRWRNRVDIAQQIIVAGLNALSRPLNIDLRYVEVRRHTMRIKPGQRLSQAGVALARRIGATMGVFDRVISSTVRRAYETAVAMGYAVDEQVDVLRMIDDGVEDEIDWDAGFAAWQKAANSGTLTPGYVQKQADFWHSVAVALPAGGRALMITHGGIVEAGAVGCMPHADFDALGAYCDYCEGVRLAFDGENFVSVEILRIGG